MNFAATLINRGPARYAALVGATALALALTAANAQDYGRYSDEPGSYRDSTETVEVIAPRFVPRTARGGEIIQVSLSKRIRTDDLDLRAAWGARELRSRVRFAARVQCEKLERRFATLNDDDPSCYRMAIAQGMDQADAAIADARGYAYGH